jgi:hypothetical protein
VLGRADEQAASDDARDARTPGLRRPDRRQKAFQIISVLKERRDLSEFKQNARAALQMSDYG